MSRERCRCRRTLLRVALHPFFKGLHLLFPTPEGIALGETSIYAKELRSILVTELELLLAISDGGGERSSWDRDVEVLIIDRELSG